MKTKKAKAVQTAPTADEKQLLDLIAGARERAIENLKAAGYSPPEIEALAKGPGYAGFVPNGNRPRKRSATGVTLSGFTAFWAATALDYIRHFDEALAAGDVVKAAKHAYVIGSCSQRQLFESYSLQGAAKGGKARVAQRKQHAKEIMAAAKEVYLTQARQSRALPTIEGVYGGLPDSMRTGFSRSTFAAHVKNGGGMRVLFSK